MKLKQNMISEGLEGLINRTNISSRNKVDHQDYYLQFDRSRMIYNMMKLREYRLLDMILFSKGDQGRRSFHLNQKSIKK